MNKLNGMMAEISQNDKGAIKKLDKTVTRVVELLMLSYKKIVSAVNCICGLRSVPRRSLSIFSEVEYLLSGVDCNE